MAGGLAKEKYDQYKVTPSLATVTKNVTLGMRSPMTLEAKEGRERSFIMIKPDGVQRGLVGEIIKRFEQKGFKLVAIRSVGRKPQLFILLSRLHYSHLFVFVFHSSFSQITSHL